MIILTDHEGEKFDLYFDFAETWWIKHISTSLLNHLLTISEWSEVPQSCPTLCDPMDCSLSGSSIHGIFQARVLEWIAISFSRDLPDPGIEPGSHALQADALPSEPPGKPQRTNTCLLLDILLFCWEKKCGPLCIREQSIPEDGTGGICEIIDRCWLWLYVLFI